MADVIQKHSRHTSAPSLQCHTVILVASMPPSQFFFKLVCRNPPATKPQREEVVSHEKKTHLIPPSHHPASLSFSPLQTTPQSQPNAFYLHPSSKQEQEEFHLFFIDNSPLPQAALVSSALPQCKQALPRGPLARASNKSHQKNSAARTAAVNSARWRCVPSWG